MRTLRTSLRNSVFALALGATFAVGVATNAPVVLADCGGQSSGGCKDAGSGGTRAISTQPAPAAPDSVPQQSSDLFSALRAAFDLLFGF